MQTRRLWNDDDRKQFLRAVVNSGRSDLAAGKAILPKEVLDQAIELKERLFKTDKSLLVAKDRKLSLGTEYRENIKELRMWVRHFYRAFAMRHKRLRLSPALIGLFRLPTDVDADKVHSAHKVIQLAMDVVKGDANMAKRGYSPMSNPSATEIQKILDRAEASDPRRADVDLLKCQVAMKKLRLEITELHQDIARIFRKSLRDLTPSRRRRIQRRYGFVFESKPKATAKKESGADSAESPDKEQR